MAEESYKFNLGKLFRVRHLESGNVYPAYTNNGVSWVIKTGNMVASPGSDSLIEQEIVYAWEKFFGQYIPADEETKKFVNSCFNAIVAEYAQKIEKIAAWQEKFSKEG